MENLTILQNALSLLDCSLPRSVSTDATNINIVSLALLRDLPDPLQAKRGPECEQRRTGLRVANLSLPHNLLNDD
jgi:hypothetical protein